MTARTVRALVTNSLQIIGVCLVTIGAYLITPTAGIIVAGVVLAAIGVIQS